MNVLILRLHIPYFTFPDRLDHRKRQSVEVRRPIGGCPRSLCLRSRKARACRASTSHDPQPGLEKRNPLTVEIRVQTNAQVIFCFREVIIILRFVPTPSGSTVFIRLLDFEVQR